MPVFDITRTILYRPEAGSRNRRENMNAIVDWLNENIGEKHGSGKDHTTTVQGKEVQVIGNGWEISLDWKGDPDGYAEVSWEIDITDEAKATLFALRWL